MDSGQPGSGALSPRSGPIRLGTKELNQSNDSLLDTGGTTDGSETIGEMYFDNETVSTAIAEADDSPSASSPSADEMPTRTDNSSGDLTESDIQNIQASQPSEQNPETMHAEEEVTFENSTIQSPSNDYNPNASLSATSPSKSDNSLLTTLAEADNSPSASSPFVDDMPTRTDNSSGDLTRSGSQNIQASQPSEQNPEIMYAEEEVTFENSTIQSPSSDYNPNASLLSTSPSKSDNSLQTTLAEADNSPSASGPLVDDMPTRTDNSSGDLTRSGSQNIQASKPSEQNPEIMYAEEEVTFENSTIQSPSNDYNPNASLSSTSPSKSDNSLQTTLAEADNSPSASGPLVDDMLTRTDNSSGDLIRSGSQNIQASQPSERSPEAMYAVEEIKSENSTIQSPSTDFHPNASLSISRSKSDNSLHITPAEADNSPSTSSPFADDMPTRTYNSSGDLTRSGSQNIQASQPSEQSPEAMYAVEEITFENSTIQSPSTDFHPNASLSISRSKSDNSLQITLNTPPTVSSSSRELILSTLLNKLSQHNQEAISAVKIVTTNSVSTELQINETTHFAEDTRSETSKVNLPLSLPSQIESVSTELIARGFEASCSQNSSQFLNSPNSLEVVNIIKTPGEIKNENDDDNTVLDDINETSSLKTETELESSEALDISDSQQSGKALAVSDSQRSKISMGSRSRSPAGKNNFCKALDVSDSQRSDIITSSRSRSPARKNDFGKALDVSDSQRFEIITRSRSRSPARKNDFGKALDVSDSQRSEIITRSRSRSPSRKNDFCKALDVSDSQRSEIITRSRSRSPARKDDFCKALDVSDSQRSEIITRSSSRSPARRNDPCKALDVSDSQRSEIITRSRSRSPARKNNPRNHLDLSDSQTSQIIKRSRPTSPARKNDPSNQLNVSNIQTSEIITRSRARSPTRKNDSGKTFDVSNSQRSEIITRSRSRSPAGKNDDSGKALDVSDSQRSEIITRSKSRSLAQKNDSNGEINSAGSQKSLRTARSTSSSTRKSNAARALDFSDTVSQQHNSTTVDRLTLKNDRVSGGPSFQLAVPDAKYISTSTKTDSTSSFVSGRRTSFLSTTFSSETCLDNMLLEDMHISDESRSNDRIIATKSEGEAVTPDINLSTTTVKVEPTTEGHQLGVKVEMKDSTSHPVIKVEPASLTCSSYHNDKNNKEIATPLTPTYSLKEEKLENNHSARVKEEPTTEGPKFGVKVEKEDSALLPAIKIEPTSLTDDSSCEDKTAEVTSSPLTPEYSVKEEEIQNSHSTSPSEFIEDLSRGASNSEQQEQSVHCPVKKEVSTDLSLIQAAAYTQSLSACDDNPQKSDRSQAAMHQDNAQSLEANKTVIENSNVGEAYAAGHICHISKSASFASKSSRVKQVKTEDVSHISAEQVPSHIAHHGEDHVGTVGIASCASLTSVPHMSYQGETLRIETDRQTDYPERPTSPQIIISSCSTDGSHMSGLHGGLCSNETFGSSCSDISESSVHKGYIASEESASSFGSISHHAVWGYSPAASEMNGISNDMVDSQVTSSVDGRHVCADKMMASKVKYQSSSEDELQTDRPKCVTTKPFPNKKKKVEITNFDCNTGVYSCGSKNSDYESYWAVKDGCKEGDITGPEDYIQPLDIRSSKVSFSDVVQLNYFQRISDSETAATVGSGSELSKQSLPSSVDGRNNGSIRSILKDMPRGSEKRRSSLPSYLEPDAITEMACAQAGYPRSCMEMSSESNNDTQIIQSQYKTDSINPTAVDISPSHEPNIPGVYATYHSPTTEHVYNSDGIEDNPAVIATNGGTSSDFISENKSKEEDQQTLTAKSFAGFDMTDEASRQLPAKKGYSDVCEYKKQYMVPGYITDERDCETTSSIAKGDSVADWVTPSQLLHKCETLDAERNTILEYTTSAYQEKPKADISNKVAGYQSGPANLQMVPVQHMNMNAHKPKQQMPGPVETKQEPSAHGKTQTEKSNIATKEDSSVAYLPTSSQLFQKSNGDHGIGTDQSAVHLPTCSQIFQKSINRDHGIHAGGVGTLSQFQAPSSLLINQSQEGSSGETSEPGAWLPQQSTCTTEGSNIAGRLPTSQTQHCVTESGNLRSAELSASGLLENKELEEKIGTEPVIVNNNKKIYKAKLIATSEFDGEKYTSVLNEPVEITNIPNKLITRGKSAEISVKKVIQTKLHKMAEKEVDTKEAVTYYNNTSMSLTELVSMYDATEKKLGMGGYKDDFDMEAYLKSLDEVNLESTEQMEGSGFASGSPGVPDRTSVLEKEMLESQIRKMQIENSKLQTENKMLKEKFNRAQAKINELESQLETAHEDLDVMARQHEAEISSFKKNSREHSELERQDLQAQIVALTKSLEMAEAEKASIEKQAEIARMAADRARVSSEKSSIIASFRTEVATFKEEIRKVKLLQKQAEKDREEETERRKNLSTQVIKLTEVKSLLQDQIQNASGGTAADKQARAMERRLRITEDRLHQERADRAMKLSQIEEKLIKENAKLQVAEKEMKRQLQRERDRHRALEVKYRELKEESQRLQGLLSDRPASTIEDSAFNHKLNSIRAGITSKKHAEEIKVVLEQIEKEENLAKGQEMEIIWVLWQQRNRLVNEFKELDSSLADLGFTQGNVKDWLKLVQDERQMYEERIATYKDNLEDISNEKEDQEKILNTRVKDLMAEKHSNHSRIKNLEDMVEAVQAENDSLREAVKSAYKPSQMKPAQPSSVPAQLEHLNSELHTAKLSINYKERAIKLLEGELETLRAQEQAKSQALKEALDELEHFNNSHLVDSSVTKTKQEQINKLRAEIKGLQAELSHTRDKYHRALYERTQLEEKLVPRSKRKLENREAGEQRRSKLYKIDREVLEKEVHEKDSQIMTLTLQYNDTEDQLQRTKKKLHLQEEHAEHLKAQVDQIQNQLWQKARTMEHMSGTSNEHEVELRTMRETLASVNSHLTQAQTEVKLKTVELNHERSKTEKLREDVHRRDDILSKGVAQAMRDGELDSVLFQEADTPQQVLQEADNKYRKVEFENEQLKHELQTVKETMSTILMENGQLTGTVREIKQDLVQERAQISHTTSQQTSLQHQLQLCTQERDTCRLENDKLVADLACHEKEAKQAVHKLMEESQKSQIEVETLYHKFGPEGRQVALELGTLRRLVEAREKEIEFLRGTINHQREELSSSKRQVEILKEENQASRDNIERLSTEIRVKVKETSGTQEANQVLSTERTRIEMEKLQLERGLDRERSEMERRGMEVQDNKKKLDKAEEKYRQLEQAHHEKNTALAKAETELRHMTKNAKQLEHDRDDLKAQLEKFNYEVRCLSNINSSLEERLVAEKSTLSDTRGSKDLLKDDLTTAIRQVELFRREYQILTTNLETERSTTRSLKEQCQQEEEKNFHLEDRVKTLELENVTLKTQINETRNLIEQYKHDKQNLYQDIQELGQKVASKDELIAKLQEKCDETVTSIQKDLQQEKEEYKKTRSELETDLNKARNQVDTLNEQLRTKEIQLEGFKTMQTDLETEIKLRQEAETKNESLGTELNSTKHQLGTLRVEYGGVTDQNQQLKKSLDESKSLVTTLKEQMRNLRDDNAKEVHNLRTSLMEATHQHEREKSELQEKLSKAEGSLKANEVALEGLKESKERLQTSVKTFEQTVESLKSQLHEETTTRKLAQQKVESLKTQINDIQQTRVGFEEKVAENKAQIAKLETELAIEKDKCKRLKLQTTDLQSANQTNEAHAQALEMQVAELESENQSLTSHVENLKQGLQGKSKKTALDLKQQAEIFESERSKLISQANQLAVDLEHAREQVALKNRDNLQLQENLLALQERIQDTENKYKRIQESLRAEEELRLRVDERNQELELEMAKNRGRRGSMDDTLSEHSEISKVMADMSKRMQDHLEQQRDAERDALSKEQNKVEDLKRKLASVESALNKEQAMHMVTQTSLDSFREDNHRLRQQLQSLKKKTNTQSSEERYNLSPRGNDDGTKSRMEEINEIIARSQTRAQQLLASGVYGDDPFRTLNASRDFSSTMPIMPVFISTPPNEARSLDGDRSHLSDDLNSSFNLSSGLLDVPKYSKK